MSSKHKNKKSKAVYSAPQAPLKAPEPEISQTMPGKGRIWFFRLTAVIIVPLLLFTLLGVGLRLGGYGEPTDFFIKSGRSGIYKTNMKFGWRFFPRNLARAPLYRIVPAKPEGTIRIFILGESAAQGVPEPAFGFGPILETMLRVRYPEVKFDIINAAMTAINSHVILEIARDCADHQPDLFVVYMGNNEVIGPFGPGTVFQKWNPGLQFIRVNLRMKSLRIVQLLGDVMRPFYHEKISARWGGMEMFMGNPVTADDPRLAAVYENFRRNLDDISSVGRKAGAAVILSTVAVNLKDCPPFVSHHRAGISNADLEEWESIYRSGIEQEYNKRWLEALVKYETAARIDDRFAELHFRMGRCLASEGRVGEAKEKFQKARDLDVLRFRADTKINRTIREVAATQANNGIYWVDSEQSLAAGGIPGADLFFEHVHLTFEGNYLLARTILDRVEAALPRLAPFRKTDSILSKQQCADALVLTPREEGLVTAQIIGMISRPPFSNQLDHTERLAAIRGQVNSLDILSSTPEAFQDVRKRFEAALEKAPDDWGLRHRLAKLMLQNGEPKLAAKHMNIALKQCPENPDLYVTLATAEQKSGNNDEAIANHRKAIDLYPYSSDVYSHFCTTLTELGRYDEAIVYYKKMLEIDPKSEDAYIGIGSIQLRQGNSNEAADYYKKALEINPANVLTNRYLGFVLAKLGRNEEAVAYLQKTLKLDPMNEVAHFNLGEVFFNLGRIIEATAHFRKAVEIDPKNAVACYWLGKILVVRGQTEEAIENYRRALGINPNFGEARSELQALLAR
jgi:tetratricopeptide (TPR) repeat protein